MDVFALRAQVIRDYADYVNSFINISDERIPTKVQGKLDAGLLWPEPLLQLNPSYARGPRVDELVTEGTLHQACTGIFCDKSGGSFHKPLRLYRHQADAIRAARSGDSYVLTTGTGSGKSLAYIIPIVDYVLRHKSGGSIKAIIVYATNALANGQMLELGKFLCEGFPDS